MTAGLPSWGGRLDELAGRAGVDAGRAGRAERAAERPGPGDGGRTAAEGAGEALGLAVADLLGARGTTRWAAPCSPRCLSERRSSPTTTGCSRTPGGCQTRTGSRACRGHHARRPAVASEDARVPVRLGQGRAHPGELHPVRRVAPGPGRAGAGVPRDPSRPIRRALADRRQVPQDCGCCQSASGRRAAFRAPRDGPVARGRQAVRRAIGAGHPNSWRTGPSSSGPARQHPSIRCRTSARDQT